jgi:hypothetical protein
MGDNTKGVTDWTRVIPKWRLLVEYKVNLFKNTDLSIVGAHGKSNDFQIQLVDVIPQFSWPCTLDDPAIS